MYFQITIDIEKCTGCGICEIACSLHNLKECNPERANIRTVRYEIAGIMVSIPVLCQQCEKPFCQAVCSKNVISRNLKTNALTVDQRRCIGCKNCLNACPFGGIFIDQDSGTAMKCNLCDGEPKCAELCPTGALSFVRQDKMSIHRKRKGIDKYLEHLKSALHPELQASSNS